MKLDYNYQVIAAVTAIILAGSFMAVNAFSGEDYSEVYSQTDNQISPVGVQLSEDTYRFSEINNSIMYGPYQINKTGYFIHEGKAYDSSLERTPNEDEDIKALHNFYLKTYLDPIFYANKEGERQKLSDFEKFESTKLLADKCGLDYNLIPEDYFSALDKNQELTDNFLKKPSKSKAEELNRQNLKTASEYVGMAGNFADLLQKNLSQNECFSKDSDERYNMALATNTPLQYRIDNHVFSDYIRLANKNAEKIKNETTTRRKILVGSAEIDLEPDIENKSFNIEYNDENIYSPKEALDQMNKRRVAEKEGISNLNGSVEEEAEEEDEGGSEQQQEIEGAGISKAFGIITNMTSEKFQWELTDAYVSEGVLEYEFKDGNSTGHVELNDKGEVAEIIVDSSIETKSIQDLNKTKAFEIAVSDITKQNYPEWISHGNATAKADLFEFEFRTNDSREANINVNTNGTIVYREIVLISEEVMEGEESEEEESEEEEGDFTKYNQSMKDSLGLVSSEPKKYHLKDYMRPDQGLKPVYGWDKNIYPNIISAERNLITVGEDKLETKDYYTVCRAPYVELTRLDWYVTDGIYNNVAEKSIYDSGPKAEAELNFLDNPGEDTLNNLSNTYERDIYTLIKEDNYSQDIPEMWKRQNRYQSKLNEFSDTYDDFYNDEHMEVWEDYYSIGVQQPDKIRRNEYNYFVATESLYPLLFMTTSDSVWRIEEMPDRFSGEIGQSGVGLPLINS